MPDCRGFRQGRSADCSWLPFANEATHFIPFGSGPESVSATATGFRMYAAVDAGARALHAKSCFIADALVSAAEDPCCFALEIMACRANSRTHQMCRQNGFQTAPGKTRCSHPVAVQPGAHPNLLCSSQENRATIPILTPLNSANISGLTPRAAGSKFPGYSFGLTPSEFTRRQEMELCLYCAQRHLFEECNHKVDAQAAKAGFSPQENACPTAHPSRGCTVRTTAAGHCKGTSPFPSDC